MVPFGVAGVDVLQRACASRSDGLPSVGFTFSSSFGVPVGRGTAHSQPVPATPAWAPAASTRHGETRQNGGVPSRHPAVGLRCPAASGWVYLPSLHSSMPRCPSILPRHTATVRATCHTAHGAHLLYDHICQQDHGGGLRRVEIHFLWNISPRMRAPATIPGDTENRKRPRPWRSSRRCAAPPPKQGGKLLQEAAAAGSTPASVV